PGTGSTGAARRTVGARAARAVEGRPAPGGGELLLDAVEAPQASAEIVDHVHERRLAGAGDDGAAVLERAVVGEDDVAERLGQGRGKAVDVLDDAADTVVAQRDLAVQPAGVGELDAVSLERIGLELADVVQEGAGHGDVAVDPLEG